MSASFPPRVVAYVTSLIDARRTYKVKLENLPVYTGFDDFIVEKNRMERVTLESAIRNLTSDIIAITKKHFPSIEVDSNDEITIANVLAALPPVEELKRIKVISARLGAP